jgi:hypothetical protein
LWQGFVAAGNITLLTSQWKAGKTTLLSLLLSRRRTGGSLAGLAVKPGKTLVISEEHASLWTARAAQLNFGRQACFLHQPFLTLPRPDEWQALLDRILQLKNEHGIDLAVIDPLAPFLSAENNARSMLEILLPLRALTHQAMAVWPTPLSPHGGRGQGEGGKPMAVLILHHPAKGERPLGQAARGSSALLGHVDISIEMRHPGGDPLTRRRRFLALSRQVPSRVPNQELKGTLDKDISIDFSPGPLKLALDYMAERYEFHFQIDDQAFQKRGIKNVGEAKVSAPNARGRLAEVLQKLLDQAKATYRVSQASDSLIIVPK